MKSRMSAFSLDGVRRCARSERQLPALGVDRHERPIADLHG